MSVVNIKSLVRMKKIFLIAVIVFNFASPVFVSAAGLNDALGNLNKIADPSKTGLSADLGTSVAAAIKTVLALVGTVFLVLTIYAGILWMTAQGEEDKVTKAKDIIKASVIGLVIIMSAYAITYFVTSKLGGATGTSSQTSNPSGAQMGCCDNTSSGVKTQSIQSDCTGFQEIWTAGPCV